jgi:hypothetical protein
MGLSPSKNPPTSRNPRMVCEYGVKDVSWVSVIFYTRPAIRDAVRCSRQAQIKLECVSALVLQIGLAREQQNTCELCIRISARYAARGRCGEGTCERRRILGEIPPDRCGSPRHSCAKSMAKREITSRARVTFVEPQTTKAKMLRAKHYLSVTRAYHAREADKRRIHTV